jgi:hypothetical protein
MGDHILDVARFLMVRNHVLRLSSIVVMGAVLLALYARQDRQHLSAGTEQGWLGALRIGWELG